jgi:hypothetical protein
MRLPRLLPGTPPRIEHHTHRVGARAGAHRQPWIVGDRGARPDEDSVGQGAQPVEVEAVLFTGDVVGVARPRRDETVDALPELGVRAARAG